MSASPFGSFILMKDTRSNSKPNMQMNLANGLFFYWLIVLSIHDLPVKAIPVYLVS